MRIENVLVPVDFSPPSRVAVNHGIALARRFRAKLTLLHVVESLAGFAQPFVENMKWETEHRDQAWRMLSALVAPEDEDDLDLQILTRFGDIESQITAVIDVCKPDLIIMGTHGRGLFGRFAMGSVTQSLLRKLKVPILTVSRVTRPFEVRRILLATDLLSTSATGLHFAIELAKTMDSELVVVHALQPVNVTFGGAEAASYIEQHDAVEARAALRMLVAEQASAKVDVESLVVEGNPAEVLLKTAETEAVDLIVMTIESKGILERALLGSTAERVIRDAHVPVLSIPSGLRAFHEEMTGTSPAKNRPPDI